MGPNLQPSQPTPEQHDLAAMPTTPATSQDFSSPEVGDISAALEASFAQVMNDQYAGKADKKDESDNGLVN